MLKRKIRSIHPGEVLREEVINAHGLSITEAAALLGVNRVTLSNVLNEKSEISPDMCYRIAFVFGGSAQIWADMQTSYNLQTAEERIKRLNLKPYQPKKAG